jgi:hypothetical protein
MVTFNIPYMYDFITKLCKQQTKVVLSYDKESAVLDEAQSSTINVRDKHKHAVSKVQKTF